MISYRLMNSHCFLCSPTGKGEMTSTFDSKSYIDLLVRYQPKPITTEAENEAAIALAQNLEHRSNRTPEEDAFLELLLQNPWLQNLFHPIGRLPGFTA